MQITSGAVIAAMYSVGTVLVAVAAFLPSPWGVPAGVVGAALVALPIKFRDAIEGRLPRTDPPPPP